MHPSAEHIFWYFLQSALFRAGSSSDDDECRFLSGFLLDFGLLVADAAKVLEFSAEADVFGVEVVSSSDGDGREADKVSFFLILSAAAALAFAVLLILYDIDL